MDLALFTDGKLPGRLWPWAWLSRREKLDPVLQKLAAPLAGPCEGLPFSENTAHISSCVTLGSMSPLALLNQSDPWQGA